jgi:hypothetical protein
VKLVEAIQTFGTIGHIQSSLGLSNCPDIGSLQPLVSVCHIQVAYNHILFLSFGIPHPADRVLQHHKSSRLLQIARK